MHINQFIYIVLSMVVEGHLVDTASEQAVY